MMGYAENVDVSEHTDEHMVNIFWIPYTDCAPFMPVG